MLSNVILSVANNPFYAECHFAECRHAECRGTSMYPLWTIHTCSLSPVLHHESWQHCRNILPSTARSKPLILRPVVNSSTREVLPKGIPHYSWSPSTKLFRTAAFYFENIIHLFTKQATLMRTLTVLTLSLELVFPGSTNGFTTTLIAVIMCLF